MLLKTRAKDAFYQTVPPLVARHILRVLPGSSPFRSEILKHEVIFIHVPKAAGTSIKTALFDGRVGGGHRRLAEYYGHDPKRAAAFFKFGFVRNPWDRLFSAYNFLLQEKRTSGRDRAFAAQFIAPHKDFTGFVRALETPRLRRLVLSYDHFQPQRYWICRPGHTDHGLDYLGRFERYTEDLAALNDLLPVKLDPEVRARSTGGGASYRAAYTNQTRQIVADLYSADIELLGYAF